MHLRHSTGNIHELRHYILPGGVPKRVELIIASKGRLRYINLRKVELQRVVSAQAHIQTRFEEVRQWISFISQEKSVVA
jgi:hypothetical protein